MISRAPVIATALICSCSPFTPGTEQLGPAAVDGDGPSRIRLVPAVVTHSTPGYLYDVGDTLSIDLDGDLQAAGFPIFIGEYDTGRVIPGSHVGPRNGGTMIVSATNLNVRECPATDCPIVGSLRRRARVEVGSFSAGWYALADGSGYVAAEHLVMLEADQKDLLRRMMLEIDLFYRDQIQPVRWQVFDTDRPLLDPPHVSLDRRVLRIDLTAHAVDDAAQDALCGLLRAFNDFAARLVNGSVEDQVDEYEIAIKNATGDDAPIARSTPTGVYCRTA